MENNNSNKASTPDYIYTPGEEEKQFYKLLDDIDATIEIRKKQKAEFIRQQARNSEVSPIVLIIGFLIALFLISVF